MAITQSWFDRALLTVAPQWQVKRLKARMVADLALRHYEAAANNSRTQSWAHRSTDPNLANWLSLRRLRDVARDLVRNNGHAAAALSTIGDHAVGTGIIPKALPANDRVMGLWKAWAETTECDADGRHDFYGLQKLVMRSVAEAGEVLVRRRWRRLEDGYALPLQLQVLEADYLDTARTMPLPNGGRIIQGVEFDVLGQRVAYWLYATHPGDIVSTISTVFGQSRRIAASEILHIYRADRPGQVRAATWFAPVLLRFKDFAEFEDATLMKQKIAACLAVITSDVDGMAEPLGTAQAPRREGLPEFDSLEPGAILNIAPGRTVEVVQPPNATDYQPFVNVSLRAIAAGIGVTYEDLTGDYSGMSFSSSRMSRIRHWARVDGWRWNMLIPQLCDPAWDWAMQAAQLAGFLKAAPAARWTPPPMPMLEPDKEGLAIARNVRSGVQTMPEALRERGIDPDEFLAEVADFNAKLDAKKIILDSDPRQTTQAGQLQLAITKNPLAIADEPEG